MGLHSIAASLLGAAYKKNLSSLVKVHPLHNLLTLAECKPQRCESSEVIVEGGARTPRSRGGQQAVVSEDAAPAPLTQGELDEIMLELSNSVASWEQGGFTFVKHLQDAARNQGRVDLMRGPALRHNKLVAVKCMPTSWVQKGPKEFAAEYPTSAERPWVDIGIVRKLNSVGFPYTCKLEGIFRNGTSTMVVSSLASDGDLYGWCHREVRPSHLREQRMRPIMGQIFAAVRWLHNLGIAHGDLSLENILLTEGRGGQLLVRVIDFGAATLSQMRSGVRGKVSYQAPEMVSRRGRSSESEGVCSAEEDHVEYDAFLSDAFALGVLLHSLASQDYPWAATRRNACPHFEHARAVGYRAFLKSRTLRTGQCESLTKVFSAGLVDILDGLLKIDPQERLTLGEACYTEQRKSVWSKEWLKDWVEPTHH